jgi:CheY-like chemotaxis protein
MTGARKILIIDDNRDAADLLRELVSIHGHEAVVAYGGEQGLAAAQSVQPEVAFVDLGMPGMDGYAVARALRRTAHGARMRLIALTAWTGGAHPRAGARRRFRRPPRQTGQSRYRDGAPGLRPRTIEIRHKLSNWQ